MGSFLNSLRRFVQPFFTEAEKQNHTIVISSLFFLVFLIVLGLKPTLGDVLTLKQEVREGKVLEKQLAEKIANLNKTVENTSKLPTSAKLIDKALPDNKDLPTLLTTLHLIFGSNNVAITEIGFEGTKPSKDPKVLILPFSIHASGSYDGILSALIDLEKNSRQIDATRLRLEIPNKGDRRFLNIVMELETYFLKKPFT